MATERAIAAHLGRLWVNFPSARPSDADSELILHEWTRALLGFDDECIRLATDAWLHNEQWMPTLAGMLSAVQDEQRIVARDRAGRALPAGPRNDEPLADAHVWANAIRAAVGLIERDPAEKAKFDTRGHDHRDGAAGCPVCSAQKAREADVTWERAERPLWSACSGCDGSHWVEIGPNVVVPCATCNAHLRMLWEQGHMEPNHRCEECAPSRRRRTVDGDAS